MADGEDAAERPLSPKSDSERDFKRPERTRIPATVTSSPTQLDYGDIIPSGDTRPDSMRKLKKTLKLTNDQAREVANNLMLENHTEEDEDENQADQKQAQAIQDEPDFPDPVQENSDDINVRDEEEDFGPPGI